MLAQGRQSPILRRSQLKIITMNPDLNKLQAYPFEKLRALFGDITPPASLSPIALSIGEPKHAAPAFVLDRFAQHLNKFANYPLTKGEPALREAIANWLQNRFNLPTLPDVESQILPVNGTREALFAFAQAIVDRTQDAKVLFPNPFYQIYEGAALLAGAEPVYLNTTAENSYQLDLDAIDDKTWQNCQLIYICTPGNPTGAVMSAPDMQRLIELAHKYDFVVASDECYSEIYPDENNPPPGLLQVAAAMGNTDYKHCVVFHSLSKRSNLPGLRSGFVAGDAQVLGQFLRYRTYHGCAMPPPAQQASIAAWQDEEHVLENRNLYRAKFNAVTEILRPVLNVEQPDAGFYLWPQLPVSDTEFSQQLFTQEHVTVLPGQYLSRESDGRNPGEKHIRMALVATLEECMEAAQRIRRCLNNI